jgi:hypothetical protein
MISRYAINQYSGVNRVLADGIQNANSLTLDGWNEHCHKLV